MSETILNVNINGVDLEVISDISRIEDSLVSGKKQWEDNYYTEAYTVEDGNVNKEDFEADYDYALGLINKIKEDPTILEEYVNNVRKKKNGKFWSNSGVTIYQLTFASEYFTDFTNAWSIPQIRLEVVNENSCELIFRNRTETY